MKPALVIGVLALAACATSPEARRVRGGGAGADVGNRLAAVHLHGGSRMYYGTPCLIKEDQCPGPLPVSGLPWDFPTRRRSGR